MMRQIWKGMVIGGLTGAAIGRTLEIFSERNLRRVAGAGSDAATRLEARIRAHGPSAADVADLARQAAGLAASAARAGAGRIQDSGAADRVNDVLDRARAGVHR
jgi:hypothetical protein